MKKIIYRKFLYDCLVFFLISTLSASVIIWVMQAVNYLDIITDDGRDTIVYFSYSLLNFPKIISKIFPFTFFFSFSYIIAKYELSNELMIYWNFGVQKIRFVNFFLFFSIILLLIQILLTSILVPKSQNIARSILRVSDFNFVDNFIKVKKFNASISDLTIYSESKDNEGNYNNIYIKRDIDKKNFQITYAKKGKFKNNEKNPFFELYNGETTSSVNNKITNFSFSKSKFNLSEFSTNTITVKKTQEHATSELIDCVDKLIKKNLLEISKIQKIVRNCEYKNLNNIIAELYKRIVIPLYLPALMLIALMLIIESKERINYSKYRLTIFLLGFFTIIFSETTLRLVNKSFQNNLILFLIPIFLTLFLYLYFLNKLRFKKIK